MPSIRLIRIDDLLRRALEKPGDDFEKAYGASLGGHRAVVREVILQTMAMLAKAPRNPMWGGYLAVDRELGTVVGTCGFKHGPEADGCVEIAYFTFPGFEGRGYATTMARELLALALESEAVREVTARTLPERNASSRVLEKVGLDRVAEVDDPEDGRVWHWVYRPGV